ncbi:tRNA (adenosine(37)-N6)-dimethylallyltransferase MiaA [soil metagenome]
MDRVIPAPFFIAGPTASGKSAVAVGLAKRIGGEIVNADAFQLFEGLDVLTAKPGAAERAAVPHHLFGEVPAQDAFDAAAYQALALRAIAEIAARGNRPVVVGGSGLYLKTLTHGLSPLPPGDPALRAALEPLGRATQVAWLLRLDPAFTDTQNPRYVSRALEVTLLTGQPSTRLKQDWHAAPPGLVSGVVLVPDRATLYARIDRRVEAMVAGGALDEVAAFPEDAQNASRAIGVDEFRAHLRGELSLQEAVAAVQRATRRFAKRQLSWFRREKYLHTICPGENDAVDTTVSAILDHFPDL